MKYKSCLQQIGIYSLYFQQDRSFLIVCKRQLINFDYYNFEIMKKILIVFVIHYILLQTACQQIPMKPSIMMAPQMAQDYSIVHSLLYPSSTKAVTTLPKDFYVKKLIESNITRIQQSALKPIGQESLHPSISFENVGKEIKIAPYQTFVPTIQNYHAIKQIYPQASIQQHQPQIQPKPIEIVFDKPTPTPQPSQQNLGVQTYKRVDNSNKEIQWKVKNLPQLRDYIVENEKEIPLSNSLIASEIGTAQLTTEGPSDKNKKQFISPRPEQPPVSDNRPLLYNSPNKPAEKPAIKDHQEVVNQNQKSKDNNNPKVSNKQILEQIEKLRYKSHKWSIIVVILILVILFMVFMFMKCWGQRNVELWQNLNKKLNIYRNATELAIDEEEQVMTGRSNELIQNQQQ